MKINDSSSSSVVQGFINLSPISTLQKAVFCLCFLTLVFDGLDTAVIGYIAPSLMSEWGIAKSALAPVLSAGIFGLAIGAMISGPLADHIGRKSILTYSVAIFGIGSLLCANAQSLSSLTALRFITGLGLGAAMPSTVTLMSEYCPDKYRSLITNAMFTGFTIGAAAGGFLAGWIIPQWGWRSLLIIGGILPLALLPALVFVMPESIQFMTKSLGNPKKIMAILTKISPNLTDEVQFQAHELGRTETSTHGNYGLGLILLPLYRTQTLLLWTTYFMGLFIFYALINWMPVLFSEVGMDARSATFIAAFFPLGGVGAIFFGVLMDRFNATAVIATGYALTAIAVIAIGLTTGNAPALMVAVFLAGVMMNTSQSSMPALAANFYPTSGRATGVSWMIGVGRFGGIASSFLVAQLAIWRLGVSSIFTIIALPAVIASLALAVKIALDKKLMLIRKV